MYQTLTVFGTFLYNFQTLIAAGIALLAAYIAAKPIWRQLTMLDQQTRIMSISALYKRMETQKKSASASRATGISLVDSLKNYSEMDGHGPAVVPLDHDMLGSMISHIPIHIEEMKTHQRNGADGNLVDASRVHLIGSVQALLSCAKHLHERTASAGSKDVAWTTADLKVQESYLHHLKEVIAQAKALKDAYDKEATDTRRVLAEMEAKLFA